MSALNKLKRNKNNAPLARITLSVVVRYTSNSLT